VLAQGLGNGVYGLYLKKVGTPALLGLNQSFRYEPASAIKVLYLLYAMLQVEGGHGTLNDDVVYYADPGNPTNPGVCPDPAWEIPSNAQHTTLRQGLAAMMQVSDNRMTRSMALKYGITTVDGYAHSIGMSSTHLRQDRIGCLFVNVCATRPPASTSGSSMRRLTPASC
jgi:beta-lactamase class A